MKRLTTYFLIIATTLSLTSCGKYISEKKLDGIILHMSKEETFDKMGSRGVARGAIVNKYGQTIEVRECVSRDWIRSSVWDMDRTYWLYFCDGKLVQWGRAGDWGEAQKMIYDINFNVSATS